MKRILLFLLFCCTPLYSQTWTGPGGNPLPVDVLVNMNTSSPGTVATTAILNAGTISNQCTVGTNCSWTSTCVGGACPNATNTIVDSNKGVTSNLGPVQMTGTGGALFAPQSLNANSIGHDDFDHNTSSNFNLPTGHNNVTILMQLISGWSQQNNGTDWDNIIIWASSFYAVVQQVPSCQGGQMPGVRMETSVTNHSSGCIGIPSHMPYYVSLNHNCGAGTADMFVYTMSGTLIGHVGPQPVTGESGQNCTSIWLGNNESGTCSGATCTGSGQEYTDFQNLMINWTTAPDPLFWTDTSLGSSVLAPGRKPAFSGSVGWNGLSGVVGGIPNRTNICSSLAASATTAQINSAIANCSASGGGVVSLAAGTYSNVVNGICFAGNSNVTLRGAGANLTLLAPSANAVGCHGFGAGAFAVGLSSGDGNSKGCISNGPVLVSGMLNAGSNTITLASVAGGPGGGSSCPAGSLKVGNPIILDQLDGPLCAGVLCDNGGILVAQSTAATTNAVSPGINGPYASTAGGGGNTGGSVRCASNMSDANCWQQMQIVTVTQCDGVSTAGHTCVSGANMTISPGLHMPNWSAGNSMSAWWSSSPIQNVGVEDMTIDNTNLANSSGIDMFNCLNCWVKGVNSITTGESHTRAAYSQHFAVVNNYFFLTQLGSTASYGFECNGGSDGLVENNIMHAVVSPQLVETCDGTVIDYNFSINDYYTAHGAGQNINARGDHSAGVDTILSEGNIGNLFNADVIHGTHNLNTFLRNYYTGPSPVCYSSGATYATSVYGSCTSGTTAASLYGFSRFYSLIGNVYGTTGVNTVYESTTDQNANVILMGGENVAAGVPANGVDPNVAATTMVWGGMDPVTGFGSPRFNCSEVPVFPPNTALASTYVIPQFPYKNTCPASQTLPNSLYYTSKPSWWPGAKAWPPIGPDVTGGNLLICTAGTFSNGTSAVNSMVTNASQCPSTSAAVASGHANSNPAMDCYLSLGGIPNGTGPVLTNFSESVCYSAAAGTNTLTVNSTNPASGVSVTVSPADNNSNTSTTTPGTLVYNTNTVVTATAPLTITNGTFVNWSGCDSTSGTNGSVCTKTVSSNVTITANYRTNVATNTLTVDSTNPASGVLVTVSPSDNNSNSSTTTPGTLTYNTGSSVNATAPLTAGGNNFLNWTGCNSTSGTSGSVCTIVVNSNVTITANYTTPTPTPSFNPTSVSFGAQQVSSTSLPRNITLTNIGTGTLNITSIVLGPPGINGADFGLSTTCGSTLTATSSCIITVNFTPSFIGAESTSVVVTDNATGSPQTVPLTGAGVGFANIQGAGSLQGGATLQFKQ